MISKRMVLLYSKAAVVVFVLCFAVVQLASIKKNPAEEKVPHVNKPKQVINPDKGVDHLQAPLRSDNKLAAINEKDSAIHMNKELEKDKVVHVQDDGFQQDKHGGIVEEEVHILGNGDLGREGFRQEQVQKPNRADDVVIVDHRDVQIEEPRDKVDVQNGGLHEKDNEDEEEEEDDEFPAHNLKDIRKLKLRELELPDHMDGVKLEIDGHLNRDYKKEIILGNHEEFEKQSSVEPEKLLEQIFDKVDKNGDHFITLAELEEWIIKKVHEHFAEANEETARIFKHLDEESKGYITWQNFHIHFLVSQGHDVRSAIKHASDYETIPLDPDAKERLIRYKFRWAEADNDPQDNKLNTDEFRAFRHPEQSKIMIDRMIQDILDNLDQNSDDEITEEEFVALPPGELDGAFADSDKIWQNERRKEFRNVIDVNGDGKITRQELKNYVDPINPNHARLEAENLMQLADENKDDQLSLNEVLDNMELFLGSKMVDTERNFHDEF